jgi:hypothetical protein
MLFAATVASRANISKARFYDLCKQGKGPPISVIVNKVAKYELSVVDKWIADRELTVLNHTYDKPPSFFTKRKSKMNMCALMTLVVQIHSVNPNVPRGQIMVQVCHLGLQYT